ncbi:glycine betaine ABC transporter substrate-binding protein [Geodermatophilus chilensis]|uniref:glycine betaine ABC transporter substrate-binding protein n=1 Tax=Geodermatophilus chilensis TaxID=2035835 RepID=UPI000C2565E7|nr:glycine betaine ABC transporter substrate-binding protein [Geodermatophilus chilensis]
MIKRHLTPRIRLGVAVTALAMVTAGCGGGGDGGSTASAGGSACGTEDDPITFGMVQGWTDQTGTGYLLANILQNNGYEVEIEMLADNAPVFAATANGDIDIFSSTWPERTHAAYMEQYGDQLEDLATYYEGAALYLAVPEYSDAKSIEDLTSQADDFGGKVYGIEPGAGLMKLTKENAFPTYELGDQFELVSSSTTAMLTELQNAIDANEEIVVTLWRPFWPNQTMPVRALEDPQGAYGDTEGLHTMATEGFSEECPKVAEMISHFKLTDEQYGSLEDAIVNKAGQGNEEKAVEMWLEENPDYAPELAQYLKG